MFVFDVILFCCETCLCSFTVHMKVCFDNLSHLNQKTQKYNSSVYFDHLPCWIHFAVLDKFTKSVIVNQSSNVDKKIFIIIESFKILILVIPSYQKLLITALKGLSTSKKSWEVETKLTVFLKAKMILLLRNEEIFQSFFSRRVHWKIEKKLVNMDQVILKLWRWNFPHFPCIQNYMDTCNFNYMPVEL